MSMQDIYNRPPIVVNNTDTVRINELERKVKLLEDEIKELKNLITRLI